MSIYVITWSYEDVIFTTEILSASYAGALIQLANTNSKISRITNVSKIVNKETL